MSIKISQLSQTPSVLSTTQFVVVDNSTPTPTSYNASGTQVQSFILQGNAATATKFAAPVNINGVAFDGSANITVTAAAGTLTGNTLASNVVSSSLTSVGTLTNLSVSNTITGSVSGSAGSVAAANITGTTLASNVVTSSLTSVGTLTNLTVTNPITGSVTGNAGSVTNGVYTTDTGTVTNTMLAGSIANDKLTNNSVTFNGVTVALGGSGSITTDIPVASETVLGAIKVGDNLTIDEDGVLSAGNSYVLPAATDTTLGGVIVGDGISVTVSGEISVPTRLFHGFSVDENSNLIYSTTVDSTIELQDQYGNDLYEDTDIGTNDYAYSLDEDGNLIVTFS